MSLEQKLRALAHEEATRMKLKKAKLDDKASELQSKLLELQSDLQRTNFHSERLRERSLQDYIVDTDAPQRPVCWARDGLRLMLERRDPGAGIGWQCGRCHTIIEAD